MLLLILLVVSVALTCAMFASRNAMLGFPSAMFWAISGGQAYIISAAVWDIYFIIAFASLLGMTTFCALGAYGLREKRDTIADEEMEKGERGHIDEKGKVDGSKNWYEDDGIPEHVEATRPTAKLHRTSKRKGEFNW